MFMWHSMLVEGSELSIEVHKKHSLRPKYLEHAPRDGPMYKANIKFDDLWKQLSSGTGENGEGIFTLCHDLAKMAKSLSIFLFFSFLFLFILDLLHRRKCRKVSHSHSHMTGSHSVTSHDVT